MTVLDKGDYRGRWYPLFSWVYTGCWIVALVVVWITYDKMPLWLKIVVGGTLAVTTPAGGDLFLISRYWRSEKAKIS